jgi:hypothetical protein
LTQVGFDVLLAFILMNNFAYIFLLIYFAFFSLANSKTNCKIPNEFTPTKSNFIENIDQKENTDKSVFIYFDQSLSMQGYTKDQPGIKNLYINVIDDLQQIAENVGSKTYYHSFGKSVKTIKEIQISQVIKPIFYECTSSAQECNNQESRISGPLNATKLDSDGTYIIVTDLFLSSNQLVGSTLNQITKPLKSILKNGKSIGIIGVMSSFNGTIYDIPKREGGTVSYTEAQKRPYYIIIIGDQKDINQIRKNLEEQHFTDPEDNYKFSLITSNPVLQNLNDKNLISEKSINNISNAEKFNFEYTDQKLPIYYFNTNQKRKLNFSINNSSIIVPGSTGVENFEIKEKLWVSQETKCQNEVWKKSKFEKISKISQDEKSLSVNFFGEVSLKNLFRGMKYFYVGEIYAQKPGTISEETFKEWSIRDSEAEEFKEGNPIEFKTLNLEKIIKILNSVANDEFQPTLIGSLAMNFNLTK